MLSRYTAADRDEAIGPTIAGAVKRAKTSQERPDSMLNVRHLSRTLAVFDLVHNGEVVIGINEISHI